MALGNLLLLISVVIFLLFSFVFSGYETAFFTLRPLDIDRLRGRKKDWVRDLAGSETEVLGTILISNLLANISASSLISLFFIHIIPLSRTKDFYLFLTSILTAIFIFVVCEATPKIYSFSNRDFFLRLSPIIIFLKRVFSPIFFLLLNRVEHLIRKKKRREFPTNSEMKGLIRLAAEEGVLDKEEMDILLALLEMERMTVKSFLTPKRKIFALSSETKIGEAIEIAKKTFYSRIPLYKENPENIVGILYVKDLVCAHLSPERQDDLPVERIMRPVSFFPEAQNSLEGLEILRKKGSHLAIVVDEFGEISGLVTLEDILEAIFGEIRDEYDIGEEEVFKRIDDKTYIVSGEMDIATLNRLLDNKLADVPEERLAGFIVRYLRRLPEVRDSFFYRDIQIEILEVVNKKIEKVILRTL